VSIRRNFYFLIFLFSLCSCGEPILHGLDELRANKVKVALSKGGISSQKIKDGSTWKIEVAAKSVNSALRILEESRILRKSLAEKAETSSSLIRTREERRSQISEQRARALEDTLESLPGVLEAHVHIFLDEVSSLPVVKRKSASSASVLLITAVGREVNTETVVKIISGGTGIQADSISMIVEAVKEKEIIPISDELQSASLVSMSKNQKMILLSAVLLVISIIYFLFNGRKKAVSKKAIKPINSNISQAANSESLVEEPFGEANRENSLESNWGAF